MKFTKQDKRIQILYFYVTSESTGADLLFCHYKSSLDLYILALFTLTKPTINKNFFFGRLEQWKICSGFYFYYVIYTHIANTCRTHIKLSPH